MIMKQFLRKTMKNVAAYVELFLSAVLVFVIVDVYKRQALSDA